MKLPFVEKCTPPSKLNYTAVEFAYKDFLRENIFSC